MVSKLTDTVDKETRRRIMQAIKSSKTMFENRVTLELWRRGFRFRRNANELEGNPDISIKKYRAVVFLDSCFWHGCPVHCRIPATNTAYWEAKIQRNRARDAKVNEYYLQRGWHLLRIWEHDVKSDFNRTIDVISSFLHSSRNT